MNTGVILIEMVAFAAIFTAIIFAYYRGDRKYSPASIHNYVCANSHYKSGCSSIFA